MKNSRFLALLAAVASAVSLHVIVDAQTMGQNVNIVSGRAGQFIGDLFRQRQNEPALGISSVNLSHMMAAYNDYRTVDFLYDAGSIVPPSLIQGAVGKRASNSASGRG
jgi:hypothetical protein